MSKKHLQRHIDEYAGRRNIRPLAAIEQTDAVIEANEREKAQVQRKLVNARVGMAEHLHPGLAENRHRPSHNNRRRTKNGPGDDIKPYSKRKGRAISKGERELA